MESVIAMIGCFDSKVGERKERICITITLHASLSLSLSLSYISSLYVQGEEYGELYTLISKERKVITVNVGTSTPKVRDSALLFG